MLLFLLSKLLNAVPGSNRRPNNSAKATEEFSGFCLWLWILRPSNKGQQVQVSEKSRPVSVSNHHGKAPWSFEYLWPLKDWGPYGHFNVTIFLLALRSSRKPQRLEWHNLGWSLLLFCQHESEGIINFFMNNNLASYVSLWNHDMRSETVKRMRDETRSFQYVTFSIQQPAFKWRVSSVVKQLQVPSPHRNINMVSVLAIILFNIMLRICTCQLCYYICHAETLYCVST